MQTVSKTRRLTRSIKKLFGPKSRLGPHKRFPGEYYKNVWFSENMHAGIELVARMEGTSKKEAADMLVGSGISRYMSELLKQHAANELANRERAAGEELIATLAGIKEVRKYLAEHGVSEYRSKKAGL